MVARVANWDPWIEEGEEDPAAGPSKAQSKTTKTSFPIVSEPDL